MSQIDKSDERILEHICFWFFDLHDVTYDMINGLCVIKSLKKYCRMNGLMTGFDKQYNLTGLMRRIPKHIYFWYSNICDFICDIS